jgi:tRNA (Thr-GGU) A37 N-methylase
VTVRSALLNHFGRSIFVKYLDTIDGTPVLDIKPVFKEFGAGKETKQPGSVADLMKKILVVIINANILQQHRWL